MEQNESAFANEILDPEQMLSRQFEVLQHQIEELGSDPSVALAGKGPAVHLGLDTEFVVDPDDPKCNRVLSVQLSLVGECGAVDRIHYPPGSKKLDRPKFSELISEVLLWGLSIGVLLEWPSRVIVCGFFLRVDLAGFGDLPRFKHRLDSIGGSVATRRDVVFEAAYGPSTRGAAELPLSLADLTSVSVEEGRLRLLRVRFVDMNRHVPVGTSLAQIGEMLGVPKLTIPDGFEISRMDRFLAEDKAGFERYALRDSQIAVSHYLRLEAFARTNANAKELPSTVSSLAAQIFRKSLADEGLDFQEEFGLRQLRSTIWDRIKNRPKTVVEVLPTDIRAIYEPFVAMCYHGGRNECFLFGPTTIGVFNDFDLASAYTTAAVDLRRIDYEASREAFGPQEFVGHVLGFALVDFVHPATTRFPALPVRMDEFGVQFPLSGRSYCTAPEIEAALGIGCQIKIVRGFIYPWKEGTDFRLFQPFVSKVRALRRREVKGSLNELYAKLIGNSVYGKTAEGLKPKRVFEPRGMTSVALAPTALTNAVIAAHITGLIRAVIAEVLAGVPLTRTVVSVSTDGFLTDADLEEIDLSGPLASRFEALCERVANG